MTKKITRLSFLQNGFWKPLLIISSFLTLFASSASAIDAPIKGNVKDVKADSGRICVLTNIGDLYCWGRNISTNVGDETIHESKTPVKIMSRVKKFDIPSMTNFAIKENGDLYAWGFDAVGQRGTGEENFDAIYNPTKILTDVEDIIGDELSSTNCAIRKNRDLYCWGANSYGEAGIGTEERVYSPMKILSDVKMLSNSTGFFPTYRCALKNDGDLYCWGFNANGYIGNDTTDDVYSPEKILTEVEKVITGGSRSCAIKGNGDLFCWGFNGEDGSKTLSPEKIAANVVEIAGGYSHNCFINDNEDVYCWGKNNNGQVGKGHTDNVKEPVKVLGNAVKLFLNKDQSCAIKTDGSLYCWGLNEKQQLGGNTDEKILSPAKILDDVSKISFDDDRFCALETSGRLHCWGDLSGDDKKVVDASEHVSDVFINSDYGPTHLCVATTKGELLCSFDAPSLSLFTHSFKPKKVSSNVTSLSLGYSHNCIIKGKGSLYCWGDNSRGQVGNDTTENVYSPVKVLSGVASFQTPEYYSTYALKKNGDLYSWGAYYDEHILSPREILTNVEKFNHESGSGSPYDCALQTNGDLYCWGNNTYGQIGNGRTDSKNPVKTPFRVLSNVRDFSQGPTSVCAVKKNDDLYCWGDKAYGQVGDGPLPCTPNLIQYCRYVKSPVHVLSNVASITTTEDRRCAIKTNGDLYCWGGHNNGFVGDGTEGIVYTPTQILSSVKGVYLSPSGFVSGCAIRENDDLYCWGKKLVGDGTTEKRTSPVKILEDTADITVGYISTFCALKTNGDLYCWGYNNFESDYREDSITSPVKIMTGVTKTAVTLNHACILKKNNELYCWGENSVGQVGNNDTMHVYNPTKILTDAADVELTLNGSCAIKTNNDLYCWGYINGGFGSGNPFGRTVRGSTSSVSFNDNCNNHWNSAMVGYSCDNGELGACLNSGVLGCYGTEKDPSVICDAEKGTPNGEICDGIDNDCDGQIDEDFTLLGETCYAENENCKIAGVYVCNGTGVVCSAKLPDECTQPNDDNNDNDNENPDSDTNDNQETKPDTNDNQETKPDVNDDQETNPDINSNGIPDLYENTGDAAGKIVRPNTKLAQSYVVKGKKKANIYFEWFSGASFNKTAQANEKKVPFKYYVRVKIIDKKTGKVVSTSFKTTKANKFTIRLNKKNKSYKFKVDYRVIIKKGLRKKKTPWSPKVTF